MNAKAESMIPELALLGSTLRAMDTITNGDDPVNTTARMKAMADMEHEPSLEEAKEVPLYDMTEAELAVVVLHDPDVNVRREALRMYRREILLRAEDRIVKALTEARK